MVITSEEVRIIDRNCEELGISVLQLMENAGASATNVALKYFPAAKKIAVCCGTGGNGGDGMVVARHLTAKNKDVKVILVGHESRIRSEATLRNFETLKQMEHSIKIIKISDSSDSSLLKKELMNVDLIIDGLLGIGLLVPPYEPVKSAIKIINSSGKKILSLDLPSGMKSDIPKKSSIMVRADKIATFHDTKPCLTIKELKEKTVICNIGVPPEAELFVGGGDLAAAIPIRDPSSHKGQNGMVLVVGGSIDYSGAPILSARAALRTGADLVIACIPEEIVGTVRSDSPNMIVQSFEGEFLLPEHVEPIASLMQKSDSLVLGPGIGKNPETAKFVLKLLEEIPEEKTAIIDADALKAIKMDLEILKERKTVITPHAGEFKILFGEGLPDKWYDRYEYIHAIAKEASTTILLKGKYDIISDGINRKVNRTGHAGMTVGGTGDVLAGVLGAFCSKMSNIFRASCIAAYLTGKAGELAAEDYGNSLLATDVIEKIPEVLLMS